MEVIGNHHFLDGMKANLAIFKDIYSNPTLIYALLFVLSFLGVFINIFVSFD